MIESSEGAEGDPCLVASLDPWIYLADQAQCLQGEAEHKTATAIVGGRRRGVYATVIPNVSGTMRDRHRARCSVLMQQCGALLLIIYDLNMQVELTVSGVHAQNA